MREPAAANFAAIAFLIGFAVTGFAPQIFRDGDTWWHLAAGQWMLTHHSVPMRDIFSYTFAGRPWTAHEWLAEILMALAFGVAGWSGLHILFGVAFGTTAWIVAYALKQKVDFTPALLATVMGLACVSGSLLAQPHLLALPLLALWTAKLVDARAQDRAPPLWLALAMLIWANLHGSFAFGLALAAVLGVEAFVTGRDKKRALRQWGLFFGAGLVAAMITPQGVDGLLFPLRLLLMPGLASVGEWLPSNLAKLTPFTVTLLVMLFVLAAICAWLYVGVRATRGAGPRTALSVGALVGFASGFPLAFSLAAWAPFSRVIPLWWMLDLWVGAILATLVAGWLYRD